MADDLLYSQPYEPAPTDSVADALIETDLFRPKTEYIIVGDEPRGGSGVYDIKKNLNSQQISDIKTFLTFMPRTYFRKWYMEKVWPSLPWSIRINREAGTIDFVQNPLWAGPPGTVSTTSLTKNPWITDTIYGGTRQKKTTEDMVWASFIELFNEANLEYINQKKIDPWTWEEEKLKAYYINESKTAIETIETEVSSILNVSFAQDPRAEALMEQFITLKPLGDKGLEITRQNAVRELLKKGEFDLVQGIIDAYRYTEDTILGPALADPIPFDIVSKDGLVVKATPPMGLPQE